MLSSLHFAAIYPLQLYNLSQEAERKEYLDKLFDYMQKKGKLVIYYKVIWSYPTISP